MEEKVLSIISSVNDEIINYEGDNLFDAGILDSLQAVDLVLKLEEGLDIDIDAEFVTEENLKTKEAIVSLIKRIVG